MSISVFKTCLHRCHIKNCYEFRAVNSAKYLQRQIVKYSKNNFLLKRKTFVYTTSIIVNRTFQTLARRNFHKIQFLKRTSLNPFKIILHRLCSRRIRITEKTNFLKRHIIFNMESKLLNLFSTYLLNSRSIYFGETDYLSSTVNLCYIVFESVRLIGRRLLYTKRGLETSPSLNLTPKSPSSTIVKNNSETSNLKEISIEKMEYESLVPDYMKNPNKRKKTSFKTKLPRDSSTSEPDLDCLSRKRSKRASKSNLNIIKSESPEGSDRSFYERPRPNYFVAVQISNPKIHENIQEIQQHILTQDNNFNECMIPTPTLHITLMVMNISDTETHKKAMQALSNFHKEHNEIMCQNPLILEFCGLSHFRNKVVFGKITENESCTRLCQLADSVEKHFAEFDIFTTDRERDFNPHLTLAKMKFPNRNRNRPNKFHPSLYAKFINNHLGTETIHSIQLLRMDGPKDSNGYYTGDELIFGPPSSLS